MTPPVKAGDLIRLKEPDYCYGIGDLALRVTDVPAQLSDPESDIRRQDSVERNVMVGRGGGPLRGRGDLCVRLADVVGGLGVAGRPPKCNAAGDAVERGSISVDLAGLPPAPPVAAAVNGSGVGASLRHAPAPDRGHGLQPRLTFGEALGL